ncbi:hypothetical protein EV138_3814 [Kribbella voronezhensis]|uniref:Uncharacterized protein n=1 Tax=Kribbella voronezhensis TaxID=2512212 RepID=A0A4R7TEN8_9ACTN|nr:hypothetical protein EV138_3814 [Kribbella voronezhensis]
MDCLRPSEGAARSDTSAPPERSSGVGPTPVHRSCPGWTHSGPDTRKPSDPGEGPRAQPKASVGDGLPPALRRRRKKRHLRSTGAVLGGLAPGPIRGSPRTRGKVRGHNRRHPWGMDRLRPSEGAARSDNLRSTGAVLGGVDSLRFRWRLGRRSGPDAPGGMGCVRGNRKPFGRRGSGGQCRPSSSGWVRIQRVVVCWRPIAITSPAGPAEKTRLLVC